MDNSVEQLATELSKSSGDEISHVTRNIESLNALNPRFSIRMMELFTKPRNIGQEFIRSRLRNFITTPGKLSYAISNSYIAHVDVPGTDDADNVLYAAHLVNSITSMEIPSKLGVISACEGAIFRSAGRKYRSKLDIFDADTDEVNRHFRTIAVAAYLLEEGSDKAFPYDDLDRGEAKSFISWAREQANMDAVLYTALARETLSKKNIIAFLTMQNDTPTALHDGLI